MPVPLIVPVAVIGGILWGLFKGSAGKKASKPGEPGAPSNVADWFMRNPTTGVVQVKPDKQPAVLAWLSSFMVAQAPSDAEVAQYGGQKGRLGNAGVPTGAALTYASNAGQNVLLAFANVADGAGNVWIIPPGAEVHIAKRMPDEGGTWAVLLEGKAATTAPGMPAPAMPVPGPTVPASVQIPSAPWGTPEAPGFTIPGTGIQVPGFNIPGMPGVPPATGGPMAPIGVPPVVPGWPAPGVVPGWPIPAPVPGPAPVLGPVPGPAPGTAYTHTIRTGDIGSRLAQWYAGDALRWKELGPPNPELVLVNTERKPVATHGGPALGFLPWNPGQVLILPATWAGAKGVPSVQKQQAAALATAIRQAAKGKGVQV